MAQMVRFNRGDFIRMSILVLFIYIWFAIGFIGTFLSLMEYFVLTKYEWHWAGILYASLIGGIFGILSVIAFRIYLEDIK